MKVHSCLYVQLIHPKGDALCSISYIYNDMMVCRPDFWPIRMTMRYVCLAFTDQKNKVLWWQLITAQYTCLSAPVSSFPPFLWVFWENCEVEGLSGACARCARPFFMNELISSDTALHAFFFLIILISRLYGCPTPSPPFLLHFINTLTCTWQKEQGRRHRTGCLAGHFVVSYLYCPLRLPH